MDQTNCNIFEDFYCCIPIDLILDDEISSQSKCLWGFIHFQCTHDKPFVSMTNWEIAKKFNIRQEITIERWLNHLVNSKWVIIKQKDGKRRIYLNKPV